MVPGNDDAGRAITLYCDLIAKAAIDGISRSQRDLGVDTGAAEEPVAEELPAETAPTGFQPLPGPRGVADDLKKLPHVSPTVEKKLNDLGVFHYSQLAELGAADAEKIGEEVGLPTRVAELDRQVERACRRVSGVPSDCRRCRTSRVRQSSRHLADGCDGLEVSRMTSADVGFETWQLSPPRW